MADINEVPTSDPCGTGQVPTNSKNKRNKGRSVKPVKPVTPVLPVIIPGCMGLKNLGNTCFMNSGLQCLFSHSGLVKYFLESFRLDDNNKNNIAGCLADLVRRCWSGQFSVLSPTSMKDLISEQFKEYRQHDCQEFLGEIFIKLQDLLNEPDLTYQTTDNESCATTDAINEEESSESGICMSDRGNSRTTTSGMDLTNDVSRQENAQQSIVMHCTSEDSNLSDAGDSQISDCLGKTYNQDQEQVTKTNNSCSPNNNNQEEDVTGNADETIVEEDPMEETMNKKSPSFEDIYMKDARTLNTNVQLFHETTQVSTDSEKFHKPQNINKNDNNEIVLEKDDRSTSGYLSVEVLNKIQSELKAIFTNNDLEEIYRKNVVSNNSPCKLKETNILAHKYHVDKEGKKLFVDLDQPDINNIKRIKIDDDVRQARVNIVQNLQREHDDNQASSRVNIVQNLQREHDDIQASSRGNIVQNLQREHGDNQVSSRVNIVQNLQREPDDIQVSSRVDIVQNLQREHGDNQASSSCQGHGRIDSSPRHIHDDNIIFQLFQGQQKNTVICSVCNHTSAPKLEAFTFLSLPVLKATKLQLTVIYLGNSPSMFRIIVDKNSNVAQLKIQLEPLLGAPFKLVLAEVYASCIVKILNDQVLVDSIDTTHNVYAFEDVLGEFYVQDDPNSSKQRQSSNCSSPFLMNVEEGSLPSSVRELRDCEDACFLGDVEPFGMDCKNSSQLCDETLNNNNSFNNMSSNEVNLESNPDIDWQHNELDDSMQNERDTTITRSSKKCTNTNWKQQTADWVNNTQFNKSEEDTFSKERSEGEGSNFSSEDKVSSACSGAIGVEVLGSKFGKKLKSCAICLEEMEDSNLILHPSCGGTVCPECLEISFTLATFNLKCPVCRDPVVPLRDFVHLSSSTNSKPQKKIVTMHVMFRRELEFDRIVFGHPKVIKLPNQISGQELYHAVDIILPSWSKTKNYRIAVANCKGNRCSHCALKDYCFGCDLSRSDACLVFHPGDHLVLKFENLTNQEVYEAGQCVEHPSVKDYVPLRPISLSECIQSYMKNSGVLDNNNPWFCPKCKKHQCAKQTTTFWKYPDTLLVHLKRYENHGGSSSKIDSEVVFPLIDLNLSEHEPNPPDLPVLYDLRSFVCHFGDVETGHYEATTKHPISDEWFSYSDEHVKQNQVKQIGDREFNGVYVLFYERKNTSVDFKLPKNLTFDDEATTSIGKDISFTTRGRTSSESNLHKNNRSTAMDLL